MIQTIKFNNYFEHLEDCIERCNNLYGKDNYTILVFTRDKSLLEVRI